MKEYIYPSRRSPAMFNAGVFPKITALALFVARGTDPNGDPAGRGPRQFSNGDGVMTAVSVWRHYRDMIDLRHPVVLDAADKMGISLDEFKILIRKLPGVNNPKEVLAEAIVAGEKEGRIPYHDYRLRAGFLQGKNDEDDGEESESEENGDGNGNGNGNGGGEATLTKTRHKAKKVKKPPQVHKITTGILTTSNARSVAPVTIEEMQITSCIGHGSKASAMGSISAVRFGIYPMQFFLNTAKQMWDTIKATPEDVEFFRRVLPHVTEMRSSVRNSWYVRNFWWYEHGSMRGDIADWKITKALTPTLKAGVDREDEDAVALEENYNFFDRNSDVAKELFGDNLQHLHDFAF